MSERSVYPQNEACFHTHHNNIMSHTHVKERIGQSDLHPADKKWLLDLINKLPPASLNFNPGGTQS